MSTKSTDTSEIIHDTITIIKKQLFYSETYYVILQASEIPSRNFFRKIPEMLCQFFKFY